MYYSSDIPDVRVSNSAARTVLNLETKRGGIMAQEETIIVVSTLPVKADGGSTVALWEQNAVHPGGEAYVAGENPVRCAKTAAVAGALAAGTIKEISEGEAHDLETQIADAKAGRRTEARAAIREQLAAQTGADTGDASDKDNDVDFSAMTKAELLAYAEANEIEGVDAKMSNPAIIAVLEAAE
jgi:hypothetical protein